MLQSSAPSPVFAARMARLRLRPVDDAMVAAVLLVIVFALLALPPIWYLLEGSFRTVNADGSPGPLTLLNYRRLIGDPALAQSALNSFLFAAGSAILAILIGGSQAWIVERTDAPLKWLAHASAIVSLAIPYILYVVAWLFVLGRVGPINDFLRLVFGTTRPVIDVQSLWGMILIEGLLWAPLVFLMLSATFYNMNGSLEEASLTSGVGAGATVLHITLKLALPSLLAVALLVFIRGIESFEVPALVGLPGNVDVLTTEIYLTIERQMPPDLGRASAFAVALLLVASGLLYCYGRISRSAAKYQTVTGKGYRPRTMPLGRGRIVAAAALMVNFLVTILLPLAALLWASLLPFYQTLSRRGFGMLTLGNYRTVFESASHLGAVRNTLLLAFATATTIMALAAVASWLIVRRRPLARLLDQLGTTPLIFPGIVLAVAVMQIFLAVPIPIYATVWILLVAFTIRYLPYGLRYGFAGALQIHAELEEVAGASGASPLTTFAKVVVPLTAPALAAGWLFIFLLTARDLSMPILLSSPASRVVAVDLFDLWVNGQGTELAAFGIVWLALMAAIASCLYLILRRHRTMLQG